jgi:hypothetical protein
VLPDVSKESVIFICSSETSGRTQRDVIEDWNPRQKTNVLYYQNFNLGFGRRVCRGSLAPLIEAKQNNFSDKC